KGVVLLHDIRNAREHMRTIRNDDLGDLIVQEVVSGPMYHVDGVVVSGESKLLFFGQYETPMMEVGRIPGANYKDCITLRPYGRIAELRVLHDRIVTAFQLDTGCTHMEFFRGTNDWVLCEAAARPPGMGVTIAHKLLSGVSSPMALLSILCHVPWEVREDKYSHVGVFAVTPHTAIGYRRFLHKVCEPWVIKSERTKTRRAGVGFDAETERCYIGGSSFAEVFARISIVEARAATLNDI